MSERVTDRTALYLMPRQAFDCFESGASDANARWSDVVSEVTALQHAFQEPARSYRAEKRQRSKSRRWPSVEGLTHRVEHRENRRPGTDGRMLTKMNRSRVFSLS